MTATPEVEMGLWASLVAQMVKSLPAVQETMGSIPGSGKSPGEGSGSPLQHSCLGNPMDRGAAVHEVSESGTAERLTLV